MKVFVVSYGWYAGLYGNDRYMTPRVFYDEPAAIAFRDKWRNGCAGYQDTTTFAYVDEIEVE